MSEININIKVLDEKINKLKELKSKCSYIDAKAEEIMGAGKSVDMINRVDKEYYIIKNDYIDLINNSILFFENIRMSVVDADNKKL